MVDTVKIPRPKFPRDPNGPNGRVEHDARGNAVWKKTRANDTPEPPDTSTLAIVEDAAEKSWDGSVPPDRKAKRKQ